MSAERVRVLYATLTSKGQLTLPRTLQDALRLRQGDRVEFRVSGGEATLRPAPAAAPDLRTFVGVLPLAGEAEALVSGGRHTPEERADLQRGPGARLLRLDDL
ncbi:AbrB/MazE/SpoVT family DNA-binding domain-containing protein [Deinococcus budaensis]|uniref:AbrB family looped-hinge helix DNA binding protein n=1 Tax=Deinococcus budaensis TaxID=1665626 RepID=A0A7W8LRC4_9DEIO|nr:AbrB/MazE/SpoVT family DNA-binding domain-containing protein [Deinococcus budaensis]MBB5235731.1 AbrB family looped-hinge helix DNA binding protein [Deinococcus budaensis]